MSYKSLKRAAAALLLTSALLSGCTAGTAEDTVVTFTYGEERPTGEAAELTPVPSGEVLP